jgi:hypothetical protein
MLLIDKDNIFLVHTMKACVLVRVQLHSFLNLVVDGCDGLASRPSEFIIKETMQLPIKKKGGWAKIRSKRFGEEKICCFCRELNRSFSVIRPLA